MFRIPLPLSGVLVASLIAVSLPAGRTVSEEGTGCPAHSLDADRESDLIRRLNDAPDPAAASELNAQLWALWTEAPDATAQDLLDTGMARIRLGDLRQAISAFDRLVGYCPAYAEGYNQRAFARYLQKDLAPALADLDVALMLSPRHVGALSGRALVLMALGRDAAALASLEAALALNPWLSERALLPVLEKRLGLKEL